MEELLPALCSFIFQGLYIPAPARSGPNMSRSPAELTRYGIALSERKVLWDDVDLIEASLAFRKLVASIHSERLGPFGGPFNSGDRKCPY
jgi:hypothetical protein